MESGKLRIFNIFLRLWGCEVVQLWGYGVYGCGVMLCGCTVVRLYGCAVIRLYGYEGKSDGTVTIVQPYNRTTL